MSTAQPTAPPHDDSLVTFPRWFVITAGAFASFFFVTFLPWSVWVTSTVYGVPAQAEVVQMTAEESKATKERLVVIEAKQFTAADGRSLVVDLKSDLNEIKSKVDNLQREFDRTIGRNREMP
jgi:hypothetical protein